MRIRPDNRRDDGDDTRRAFERRCEFLIELEVWWRLRELGVPHDEKAVARFEHFRFGSDHLRKLEAAEQELAHARRTKNAEEAAARIAARAAKDGAGGGTPQ